MGTVIRSILILPAAVAACILIAFPIHWSVMVTFGGWGHDPIIVIGGRETLATIERFAQSLLGPLAFIIAGVKTAPSRRFVVSVLLSAILAVGLIFLHQWIDSLPKVELTLHPVQVILIAIGISGGILYARAKERGEELDTAAFNAGKADKSQNPPSFSEWLKQRDISIQDGLDEYISRFLDIPDGDDLRRSHAEVKLLEDFARTATAKLSPEFEQLLAIKRQVADNVETLAEMRATRRAIEERLARDLAKKDDVGSA